MVGGEVVRLHREYKLPAAVQLSSHHDSSAVTALQCDWASRAILCIMLQVRSEGHPTTLEHHRWQHSTSWFVPSGYTTPGTTGGTVAKIKKIIKNVVSVKLSCIFLMHPYRCFCLSCILYAAFIAIEWKNIRNLMLFPHCVYFKFYKMHCPRLCILRRWNWAVRLRTQRGFQDHVFVLHK